ARAWLPATLIDRAPWQQIALTLRSRGRVDHLESAAPALRATSELGLEHAAFDRTTVRSLALRVASQGTALKPHIDLELTTKALAIDGGAPGDDHLTLSATLDRTAPALEFRLAGDGRAEAKLSGALSFERAARAVRYDVDLELARLAALAPLAA